MRTAESLIGRRYTHWTVRERAPNHGKQVYWWCECVCGKVRAVGRRELVRKHSQSCGCRRGAVVGTQSVKRGADLSRRCADAEQVIREVIAGWPASLARYAQEAMA